MWVNVAKGMTQLRRSLLERLTFKKTRPRPGQYDTLEKVGDTRSGKTLWVTGVVPTPLSLPSQTERPMKRRRGLHKNSVLYLLSGNTLCTK